MKHLNHADHHLIVLLVRLLLHKVIEVGAIHFPLDVGHDLVGDLIHHHLLEVVALIVIVEDGALEMRSRLLHLLVDHVLNVLFDAFDVGAIGINLLLSILQLFVILLLELFKNCV